MRVILQLHSGIYHLDIQGNFMWTRPQEHHVYELIVKLVPYLIKIRSKMSLYKFCCIGSDIMLKVGSDWPLFCWIFMSMEFLIQHMKLHVTFGNSVMTLHWEENLVSIFLPPKNEMHFKFRYWLILHIMKCIRCSQILLTCDPQYFQGRVPFKLLHLLVKWH